METLEEIKQWYVEFGGEDCSEAEAERRAAWNAALANVWDQGASRAGRYGHEDGWYNGGPYRDNPYRSEAEIIDLYGDEEEGWY